MEQAVDSEILRKLNKILIDVSVIKENMVDMDMIMTAEESSDFEKSLSEFDKGEVFSLRDIEEERENAGFEI